MSHGTVERKEKKLEVSAWGKSGFYQKDTATASLYYSPAMQLASAAF